MSLVDGDKDGKYQAKLKIRGGSIIPTGKIIQNTTENSLDPLMLLVCLDEQGKASGSMYWDAGDGWSYQKVIIVYNSLQQNVMATKSW